eukprot:188221-Chlamydomonas_euryale.AAC.1
MCSSQQRGQPARLTRVGQHEDDVVRRHRGVKRLVPLQARVCMCKGPPAYYSPPALARAKKRV